MKFGQIAAMSVVTLFAIAVMVLVTGSKGSGESSDDAANDEIVETAAPVTVFEAKSRPIEILQRYSGMIEPRERLTLAFEIPGRIESLGKNANGQTFDEGVRVSDGDVLAVLDMRELKAQQAEADALLLQAEQENERAIKLSQKNPLAINKVELLSRETTLKIHQARAQLAAERLRYASLRSSVDGVISKRFLLPGESLNSHQPVFEILQVDRVLLVVGVPESRIRPLLKRHLEQRRLDEVGAVDEKPMNRAYIRLVGSNTFGQAWKPVDGVVHSISESSDDTTGLFQVEISIENDERTLRPGQIAVAEIVADEIEGFELPSTAGIFQAGRGFFYALEEDGDELRAVRVPLKRGAYLEQNNKIILKDLPAEYRRIVVRGQHRLAPGRLVRVTKTVSADEPEDATGEVDPPVPAEG